MVMHLPSAMHWVAEFRFLLILVSDGTDDVYL